MKLSTFLELGRTSNVPTVWSNVLCGTVLAGAALTPGPLLLLAIVGTAFYVGGMLLNDAFDAPIDARERPERPIPSGRASRREVFAWGFALLGLGMALIVLHHLLDHVPSGWGATAAGAATALAIVIYDRWHKHQPWSPVVMGFCRAGLYMMAALTVAPLLGDRVFWSAGALLLYVVGLTHIARFETGSMLARVWPVGFVFAPALVAVGGGVTHLWSLVFLLAHVAFTIWAIRLALGGGPGRIPRAVVSLIAGIALVDATFMAAAGSLIGAVLAVVAFGVTLLWQRRIRGT